MAGSRGETPDEWENSLRFAESLDVTRYHVFPYSERPGTKALQLGDAVSQEEKHRRVGLLTTVSDQKMDAFMKNHIGRTMDVLWEQPSGQGMMHGLTENYIRIEALLRSGLINTVSPVVITGIHPEEPEVMTAELAVKAL